MTDYLHGTPPRRNPLDLKHLGHGFYRVICGTTVAHFSVESNDYGDLLAAAMDAVDRAEAERLD